MANGRKVEVFHQEVIDAIARKPHSDLTALRELCEAVETDDGARVLRLTQVFVSLRGVEDPLHAISYELFRALMARMLLRGWFEAFDLLIKWQQTLFGTEDSRVAHHWGGIVEIVTTNPRSLGLLTRSDLAEEFKRVLHGLEGAIRHYAKVRLPPPAKMGAPPEGPTWEQRRLPEQLLDAIEQFFRVLQIVFQQMLELALIQLEQDFKAVAGLRLLQMMQTERLWPLLTAKDKAADLAERLDRILNHRVRVTEFRYGRGRAQHRFLDMFPPYDARSVVFNSLDREDKAEPYVRGERIGNLMVARDRQLAYWLASYGHPWGKNESPADWHLRRRALITAKHRGKLSLSSNDDLVTFLNNFFDVTFEELGRQGQTSQDKLTAGAAAWRATIEVASLYFDQTTGHSRLNLTEGEPNYLTHVFPRNLSGRLLHDCGVYGVRAAFILLTVIDQINRSHGRIAGTVRARWVRLPLHVGLMIETDFGLLVQHNEYGSLYDAGDLKSTKIAWADKRPDDPNCQDWTTDSQDQDALNLKFHEDVAANAFSSDLDMPISSAPVLEKSEPVTTKTIWNSYQKKVVQSHLFSRAVGASNAPLYQFDVRYLRLSELERQWYNQFVLRFWNWDCPEIWRTFKAALLRSSDPAPRQEYARELNKALDKVQDSYDELIRPKKNELSKELRDNATKLLLPNVRIVAACRLETVLPAVEKVEDHLGEISKPNFTFKDFVPPFARPEEVLLEVP